MDLFSEYARYIQETNGNPIQLDFLHDYLAALPTPERTAILALSLAEWDQLLASGNAPLLASK